MEFVAFPKLSRYNRDIIITEKIDGTNAQVSITEDGQVFAGSRNRWLTVDKDNMGFAKWVEDNKDDLMQLGPGRHFGEWWGQGIQRGYGLKEKRFSLFNVSRWNDETKPKCCHVVPILYSGPWVVPGTNNAIIHKGTGIAVKDVFELLAMNGSYAVPGYMKPEGIVVFHTAGLHGYKITFEHDATGKWEVKN